MATELGPEHPQANLPTFALANRVVRRAFFLLLVATLHAHADDAEPRAYSNAPVGVNFLLVGYSYTDGGPADASSPLDNANLTIEAVTLGYSRSLDVFGNSGSIALVTGGAHLSGSADFEGEQVERKINGTLDPRIRFAVNFYGAPALSPAEYAHYQQDLIVGASVVITMPYGQYDTDRLVNLGANRWAVKPELGVSKRIGSVTLEIAAGARFFSDNDEFRGQTLSQDPIYTLQTNLIYNFKSGVWLGLGGTYATGGETAIDGVKRDDQQENSRFGTTLAVPIDRKNSLKFFVGRGVHTRAGVDYDIAAITWQHRFGGGY